MSPSTSSTSSSTSFFLFVSLRAVKTWKDPYSLSRDNLVENLLGDFEYEVQVPYLFYRNAAQEVNGIWFYNSLDCEAVTNLFLRILNAYSKVPPKPKVTSKSEFEELEAVPTSSIIEGPLEPTSAATPTPDVADETFVKFFSNAEISKTHQLQQSATSHLLLLYLFL
ncbi:mRNA-decapping enzyme-like protein isoform X2 [Zingiber officinale]|uniref:mRNA-decapping enzyme-like protein isoform X2 n=1 Tax=Zingiber officinale TaxID=94328 RepID=UPI001C4C047F|nr:mRNA-decapping enzyme-like protein isoform X2 [Zingiber officinale]